MTITENPIPTDTPPPKFRFTDNQIDLFLEKSKERPGLVKELLINAQEGNPDDIDFLFELQMRRKITLSFSGDA